MESKNLFSHRFNREIILTTHAKERMAERDISEAMVLDIIETGDEKAGLEPNHFWMFKEFANRPDNLICLAISREKNLIVITAMTNFTIK